MCQGHSSVSLYSLAWLSRQRSGELETRVQREVMIEKPSKFEFPGLSISTVLSQTRSPIKQRKTQLLCEFHLCEKSITTRSEHSGYRIWIDRPVRKCIWLSCAELENVESINSATSYFCGRVHVIWWLENTYEKGTFPGGNPLKKLIHFLISIDVFSWYNRSL